MAGEVGRHGKYDTVCLVGVSLIPNSKQLQMYVHDYISDLCYMYLPQ